jgi:23S rRNA (cytosine1962-C5)-methyltransferase
MDIQLLTPQNWRNYELIDSGDYEKLERFGNYILRRPEPQAVWKKTLPEKEWERKTEAWFKKETRKTTGEGNEKGKWILKPHLPQQWFINYAYRKMNLRFRLGLTAFKHVGIFPEQAENWNYIYDTIRQFKTEQPQVLNLFAYTGGASLAAKAAGADVTHVDSVRQVLNWAHENKEASHLENIRWVCEDALRFVKREAKRGKRYQGLILDPPAYGHGPDGEKWILEDNIAELMENSSKIADETECFCVLNLYSMGFSSLIARNLMNDYFPQTSALEYGELFLPDHAGRRLPLSVFSRMRYNKI